MRWLAVSFVTAVLILTAVSIASGGILTGSPSSGGFTARWDVGCSPGSTGPHQCLSGRADNSASYCSISSTGATSMIQNCNECDCDTATGVNNHDCSSFTGACVQCLNTCRSTGGGGIGYNACSASRLECQRTGGLCDGTYSCYCNSGPGGQCTGFVCSGRRSADRTCTSATTCGTTAYSCVSGRCGAECSTGYTQIVNQCVNGGTQWQSYQLSCTATCQITSTYPYVADCKSLGSKYCVSDRLHTSTGCVDASGCTSTSVVCPYGCAGSSPNAYCETEPDDPDPPDDPPDDPDPPDDDDPDPPDDPDPCPSCPGPTPHPNTCAGNEYYCQCGEWAC
jgi:hypothetical protein